jgi:membrane protein DedA with SNARE-associated domain
VTASVGSAGVPGLLPLMEAGVPVPGDLVMLLVGERVSAAALPLWLAAAGVLSSARLAAETRSAP